MFPSVLAALLSIMNPLGTVPIFVGLTQEHSDAQRSKIALNTAIAVLLILLISFIAGHYLLLYFGISIQSLKVAGGLIIASSLSGTWEHRESTHYPASSVLL